jgi:transposase-like protein
MKRYQKTDKTINHNSCAFVTMGVDIDDIMVDAAAGFRRVGQEAALQIMQLAMERERQILLEDGAGYRHGEQRGWAIVDGRRIQSPHLRSRGADGEIPLKSYKAFQNTDENSQLAFANLIRGISMRDYAHTAKEFANDYGLSKTGADAKFIREADEKLRQLLERDLSGLDITAIFMDGKGFADTMIIAAIGVCSDGKKVTLGIWQGTTENTVVCQGLLKDLIRRGLNASKVCLFVIDGGKGLRSAIKAIFGNNAFIQRCIEHKKRNVKEHLPDDIQPEYQRKLKAAYNMTEYVDAKRALCNCIHDLERINPSAARSLEEGLEETLTLHRLRLPDVMRKSLRTTNCIESAFSQVAYRTDRVKRWRNGIQVQRWAGCALLLAEERWHKVSGWRLLEKLRTSMEGAIKEQREDEPHYLSLQARS